MANRNHMVAIPQGVWQRAIWAEESLSRLLDQVPLHMGLEGLDALEASLFPRPQFMPLDPTCPECGLQTDSGTVERVRDVYRVLYDCGHMLELTQSELEQRLVLHGRPA